MTDERPLTIRERIKAIQVELREKDVLPLRGAELLTQLTAMLGNCNDEFRAADVDYKRILLAAMQQHKAASRAKIEAETSPQYVRRQEAIHTKELAVEMIRSLKACLRTKQEEMRLAQ